MAGVVHIQTVVLVRDIFTVWWRVTHKDTILILGYTITSIRVNFRAY